MFTKLKRKIKDIKYRYGLLEQKQKQILAVIASTFAILLILLVILILKMPFSVVKMNISGENYSLSGLNKSAKYGTINDKGYAFFKFSENQRSLIKDFYEEETNAALRLKIRIYPSKKQFENFSIINNEDLNFVYGFLNDKDFSSRGRFHFNRFGHIAVKGNLSKIFEILKQNFDSGDKNACFEYEVSFAIPKKSSMEENNIPRGFFVDSGLKCKITSAEISTATLGFDFSSDMNFYGFSSNGGKLDFLSQTADFSGAGQIFSLNFSKDLIPNLVIKFTKDCPKSSLTDGNVYVGANVGGEKIRIKCIEGLDEIKIPAAGINSPYSVVDIYKHKDFVTAILLESEAHQKYETEFINIKAPINTDPGLILDWNQKNWRNRDFEVYKWNRFSDILFFDIKDLSIQEKFFSRLAFFVEKEGYKGKILTNEQLKGKHGYNAHDYSVESMAAFFNKAYEINFQLNPEEITLKNILLVNGMLKADSENDGFVVPVKGGLVSISKETPGWSRRRLLAHEGWHTLYFADEEFRNFVAACFYTMDPNARDFIIGFFKSQPSLGYDVNDTYLLINEFMAYTLQQPVNQVADYYKNLATWPSVKKAIPELCKYIQNTNAQAFEDVAIMLNDFIFTKWGIESGNISLITFE